MIVFENVITAEFLLKVNGKNVYMLTLIPPLLFFVLKMSSAFTSAESLQVTSDSIFFMEVNNMNHDQTDPMGAV